MLQISKKKHFKIISKKEVKSVYLYICHLLTKSPKKRHPYFFKFSAFSKVKYPPFKQYQIKLITILSKIKQITGYAISSITQGLLLVLYRIHMQTGLIRQNVINLFHKIKTAKAARRFGSFGFLNDRLHARRCGWRGGFYIYPLSNFFSVQKTP